MRALLLPLVGVLGGCGVAATGAPGTPQGGDYCFTVEREPKPSCYPTDHERTIAMNRRSQQEQEAARHRAERDAAPLEGLVAAAREEEERKEARRKARDEAYAERKRLDQERKEAEAARAAELKRLAGEPSVAVPAISAIMCTIDAELVRLRVVLDQEKRAAALAGPALAVDRSGVALEVVQVEDELRGWREALGRFGARQLPCQQVQGVVACRGNVETCAAGDRDAAEVWAKEQDTLWGSDRRRSRR